MTRPPSDPRPGRAIRLVPLGGLGNRLRFVSTAVQASADRDRVIVVNLRTSMFPGSIADFLDLPARVRVVDRSFGPDRLLIRACRLLTPLAALAGGRIAPYGANRIGPACRLIASYRALHGMDIAHLPLRPVAPGLSLPYNAVHIRRADHARALALNPLAKFEAFIETSDLPVYVASDSDAIKDQLQQRFGDRVITRRPGLQRASPADLAEAFGDLWMLIRAARFLGSRGSSFSMVALAHRARQAAGPDGESPARVSPG